jgi:subtilisin-like proprotein convertase family protein
MLPPGRTIISEIEVDEDYPIGDLDVQISITHTSVGRLDGFLVGPDGQRIELFTEVGGRDDHFDRTVFDDQARVPINKARPPFEGSFMPEGLVKRQPSLSHFEGQSVKGLWQLIIRGTRSDRFGMLHRWSLIVRPQEQLVGGLVSVSGDVNSDSGQADSAPRADRQPEATENERASQVRPER